MRLVKKISLRVKVIITSSSSSLSFMFHHFLSTEIMFNSKQLYERSENDSSSIYNVYNEKGRKSSEWRERDEKREKLTVNVVLVYTPL